MKFYEDENEEFKSGFIRLIFEEKQLGLNLTKGVINYQNYKNELLLLISVRIPYYCQLLLIHPEDIADFKKKRNLKWWLALAGAISIIGFCGIRKLCNKTENKKDSYIISIVQSLFKFAFLLYNLISGIININK